MPKPSIELKYVCYSCRDYNDNNWNEPSFKEKEVEFYSLHELLEHWYIDKYNHLVNIEIVQHE